MTVWNIAELFEGASDQFPDREAVVTADQGARTFGELADATQRFAAYLAGIGIGHGDHVAVYAQNCVEWITAALGTYRVGAAPVNINYRYQERELDTVLSDSAPKAVVVSGRFAARLAQVSVPSVVPGGLVVLEDGTEGGTEGGVLPGAVTYRESLTADPSALVLAPRSGDELYVMYTGGTTGSPKGVIWRHEDVLKAHGVHRDAVSGREAAVPEAVLDLARTRPPVTMMALGQMMHANGLWTTLKTLLWGDRLVIQRRFDPAEVWGMVAAHRVQVLGFVGDAMARPLADELHRNPGRWDLSSLQVLASAAAVFSAATQDRFLELLPGVSIMESIGTSETGLEGAAQITPGAGRASGPTVAIGGDIALVDEDNCLVPLVPGAQGRIARTGHIALRYHNDPVKTAMTFVEIAGRRWAVPGDHAVVVDEHTIVLRGRGSASINTGGEKVFAEEVEAAIKAHPSVADALVVGVPDDRWGQAVAAVVQFRTGESASLEELRACCRITLADFKLPRVLARAADIARSPSGKPDYRWARARVLEAVALEPTGTGGAR